MGFVVVGTAGHVDHGKTVLVRALTGVDTDRLKEEKERGISIELGFAPLKLPDGQVVGLVDVPGHERFIRQMLAGAGGIDLVMLVVAADEGVMPQTREHLAIVDLLGVRGGVLVLTKKDLVSQEWLDLVAEEVRETVQGTVLAEAPMVAVSAVTGEGLEELRQLLAEQARRVAPRKALGPARLPIDRVFSVRGFGTVVTGTLWSGTLRQDQSVVILPANLSTRIRQMEVHHQPVSEAFAGQRVACNLVGVEVHQIERGHVLVSPGYFRPTSRLDVQLRLLPAAPKSLHHAQPLWFYLGTAEVLGKVLLLDRDELLPGETGLAQLALQEPVVAARLDRFVIRSYSPMTTLGGGIVIEPYAHRHKRHRIEVLIELERKLEAGPTDRVLQVLEARPWGMPAEELVVLAGLAPEELGQAVEELAREGKIVELANEGQKYLVSADHVSKWQEKVLEVLGEFHHRHPLRKGMPREELRTKYFSPLPAKAFHSLLDYWQNQGVLVDQMGAVARHDFVPQPTAQEKEKLRALSLAFRQGGWQPPAPEQVFTSLRLTPEEGQELLRYLVQEGELVKVADGLYFSREAVEEAKKKVAELIQEHGGVELAAVRDALGSSRKFVLPLMEYFDQIHFTRRVGDKRFLYGSPGGRVGT